ncbi:MAG: lysophospholipid acyltransferase family protein [Salinivirgaceae bacterium]|nr:lysophospholipid acyltransferase family protein [Salinivirgaceae bacterium]
MATKFKVYIIRPVRNFVIYHLLHSIFVLGQFMPRRPLLWWHGVLAKIVYRMLKKTRRIVEQNLAIAFGPEKRKGEYHCIGQQMFVSLGKTFTDYALFWKMKTREQFSRYFRFEGEENLKAAYEKGKGVLCLVTHTSGWEFSAFMPPVLGYKSMGVSSRIKNPALNKLMIGLRESRGMANITRDHCYDTLVERLKKGECLIIMIDQDSKNIRGEFLKFFGKEAYTPIGCARLAMDTGAAVVPMYTYRNDDDTYVFKMLPEIPFERKETDLETIRYNTQKHNDAIEQIIREHPEQWVWMHERWKTTPEILRQHLERKRIAKENSQKQQ